MDETNLGQSFQVRYEFCRSDPDSERIYQVFQTLLPVYEIIEIIDHELQLQSHDQGVDSL